MDSWKKSLSMRDGSGLIGSSEHVPSLLVERCWAWRYSATRSCPSPMTLANRVNGSRCCERSPRRSKARLVSEHRAVLMCNHGMVVATLCYHTTGWMISSSTRLQHEVTQSCQFTTIPRKA
jgi:hypothetical protein